MSCWGEEDTAHTRCGCIDEANHQWVFWDHFSQAGRLLGDVAGQGFKVIEVVSEVSGDLDTVLVSMGQAQLQGTEQTC